MSFVLCICELNILLSPRAQELDLNILELHTNSRGYIQRKAGT